MELVGFSYENSLVAPGKGLRRHGISGTIKRLKALSTCRNVAAGLRSMDVSSPGVCRDHPQRR
jgi:hypothetical protein